jgi:hypothetical protein
VTSLFVILKYFVRLGLLDYLRLFDFSHPLDIFGKIVEERRVQRCIIHGHNILNQLGRAKCQRHGGLRSPSPARQQVFDSFDMANLHGMANQGGFLQSMLVDKSCDIVRHGDIVMARVMRGVTMIA